MIVMTPKTIRIALIALSALIAALVVYGALWYLFTQSLKNAASGSTERARTNAQQLEILALEKLVEETAEQRAQLDALIVTDDRLTEFLELVEYSIEDLDDSTRLGTSRYRKVAMMVVEVKICTHIVPCSHLLTNTRKEA